MKRLHQPNVLAALSLERTRVFLLVNGRLVPHELTIYTSATAENLDPELVAAVVSDPGALREFLKEGSVLVCRRAERHIQ